MVIETIPKGYKQTEIGIIPDEWEVKRLGECLLKNPDYGINAAAVAYNDTLPTYLRITDISEDGKYLSSNKVSVNNTLADSYYLEEGDIVFARTGASVGKTYLYNKNDGKLVFAGFLIRVKVNPKLLDCKYLIFLTQTKSYLAWVLANSMRSGQPGLNSNEYQSLQIPVPPTLTEQSAIARVLSDTDTLIESLDKLIAKKKNIKQGAMQQLLTGKKRLPGFKDEWDVKKIGAIAEMYSGGTPSTFVPDYWNGSIRWMSSGELNLKKVYDVGGRITELGLKNSSAKLIPPKCVLIGLAGQGKTRGTVAINYVDLCTNQSIGAIFPNETFVPEYLYYNLNTRYNELRNLSTGEGGRGGLNLTIIRNILVPLPIKEEQIAIARVLSDMDVELEELEQKRDKYEQLKTGLMQQLLTGKIRLK
ncbi:restriction endonuclease subunit S [Candidatus Woesearchaeota archaeon]|nr:restriction endonuclease subunit S [Candidatus Woesearchaeota archaeon]